MFKDGEKPTKIAKIYLIEKNKIEKKSEKIKARIKLFDKNKKI